MIDFYHNNLTLKDDTLNLHRILRGKIGIENRVSLDSTFDGEGVLNLIYTPGVAHVAKEISNDKDLAYSYTSKWNNVAIICDGTRVLGLGNTGPESAIPVMEGKSVLFKALGGINAFPLCISTPDKEEIIKFAKAIQPMFGAVNIEDIESPKVLEIVERLEKELEIPVFHDDRHGTAVITLAAVLNSLRLLGKRLDKVKVVIAGAGSAGYGISKILDRAGCRDIVVLDSKGALYDDRPADDRSSGSNGDNPYKNEIAKRTNPEARSGSLADMMRESDVFIGVSGKGGLVNKDMVRSMNPNAIVFALSNPDPEILPSDALQAGAKIVATGRSDFANQINNAVVFPSILRALLDLRVKNLDEDMLVAVANAIAYLVEDDYLKDTHIVPKIDDPRTIPLVTKTLRDCLNRHLVV